MAGLEGSHKSNFDERVVVLLEEILEQLRMQTPQSEAQTFGPGAAAGGAHDASARGCGPSKLTVSSIGSYAGGPDARDSSVEEEDYGLEGEVDEGVVGYRHSDGTPGTHIGRKPSARTINRIAETSSHGYWEGLRKVPGPVQQLLFMSAAIPRQMAKSGWRRRGYELYQALLVAAWVLAGARYVRDIAVPVAVFGTGPTLSTTILATYHFIVALPFWRVWRGELAAQARLMRFFQQMVRQNFPWGKLTPSIRAFWLAAAAVNLIFVLHTVSYVASGETWHEMLDAGKRGPHFPVVRALDIFCDVAGLPASVLWTLVTFTHVWFVYFVCCLHQHDLHCYASAVKREIEAGGGGAGDTVQALRELEVSTTSRLRHASKTWVRFVVLVMGGLSTGFLVSCLHLLSAQRTHARPLVVDSLVSAFLLILSACLGAPLAFTAETFEYDVLRSLNNPLLMEKSQKFFGQQFLNHLVLLQWGFRFGGSVITVSMVRNVIGVMFVTMATTVSRAFFARADLV